MFDIDPREWEYGVATSTSIDGLKRQVNEDMQSGWIPTGPIAINVYIENGNSTSVVFYQTTIRKLSYEND